MIAAWLQARRAERQAEHNDWLARRQAHPCHVPGTQAQIKHDASYGEVCPDCGETMPDFEGYTNG